MPTPVCTKVTLTSRLVMLWSDENTIWSQPLSGDSQIKYFNDIFTNHKPSQTLKLKFFRAFNTTAATKLC